MTANRGRIVRVLRRSKQTPSGGGVAVEAKGDADWLIPGEGCSLASFLTFWLG